MIETAIIYIKRNKIKSLIIILIIATIILGEIIGLLLSNASEKSERDAYLYNGAALVIEDDNGGFTKSDYDEIRKVKYVTGLGAWRELIADPVDTENVKEHKGIDPENKDVRNRADKMVIVANMDVQQYSLFSWEKNVSLIEGEFPTYENKGIIVEQRYAKKNNLKVGDEVKYTIGDQSEATSLQICGIYKVDSDFEIYDSNEEGTSVYIHSPYNSIYVDYDYIVELLGLEYTASTGSEVYIDKIEHIDAVKKQLKKMYGDNVEIFGPSGSGKTTCLSLLAGLEKPDEGEILLDGENIQNIGGRKLRQNSISLVFQDYQLFDYMTSLENVMVAAQISLPDVPKKELIKMCRDSLVMVGLDDSQITRKVTELSGGQQQRVAIARALITDAKYILADEPTGNLDKENRRKIVELLQQIAHEQDRCVIVVTHSDYVKKKCDICYEMGDDDEE